MTRELTELDVLSQIFTEAEYLDFAMKVYNELLESEQFKSKDQIVFAIHVYKLNETDFLHVEATLKKEGHGINNFGFVRFVITDDFDFTLDRWNEAKEIIKD